MRHGRVGLTGPAIVIALLAAACATGTPGRARGEPRTEIGPPVAATFARRPVAAAFTHEERFGTRTSWDGAIVGVVEVDAPGLGGGPVIYEPDVLVEPPPG